MLINTLLGVAMLSVSTMAMLPNGERWLDTDGNFINAHGGGMLKYGGKYYWYGEHRIGKQGKLTDGVSCYSSADLKTWKYEGLAFEKPAEKGHPIAKGADNRLERPKVVYCGKTGVFVMFFHHELNNYGYNAAQTAIASATRPEGPFKYHRSVRPNACTWPVNAPGANLTKAECDAINAREDPQKVHGGFNECVRDTPYAYVWHYASGQMSRDQTLYIDDDGKAYHIFASENNSSLHIAELTGDFLDWNGKWYLAAEKTWTEAPAVFKHGRYYYLVGSGCTGWLPNAAHLFRAEKLTGPWQRLENPCRGVSPVTGLGGDKTYGCQSTYALELDNGEIIVMFDEWRPDDLADSRYHWFKVRWDEKGLPYFDAAAEAKGQ